MLSEKMETALNQQLNRELYSAYLYLSMAAYSTSLGLQGCAKWFTVQAQEEVTHAMKFYNYIHQQGRKVTLEAIEAPQKDFDSITEAFNMTLEHEKLVTSLINKLVELAKKENDVATEIFLQWFITEQVEEESSASEIVQKFELGGDKGGPLLMIDSELAQRTFTPPQAEED